MSDEALANDPERARPAPGGNQLRILVVDDEQDLIDYLTLLLKIGRASCRERVCYVV